MYAVKRQALDKLIVAKKEELKEQGIKISSPQGEDAIKVALTAAGFSTGRSSFRSYDDRLLNQLPYHVLHRQVLQ